MPLWRTPIGRGSALENVLRRRIAFDAIDDPNCGCETCRTPWGSEPPTLRLV